MKKITFCLCSNSFIYQYSWVIVHSNLETTRINSDLQYWVKKAKIFNYADDTTSVCSAKELEKVLKDLEADADIIISYMESNGLMANHKKNSLHADQSQRPEHRENKDKSWQQWN